MPEGFEEGLKDLQSALQYVNCARTSLPLSQTCYAVKAEKLMHAGVWNVFSGEHQQGTGGAPLNRMDRRTRRMANNTLKV